MSRRSRRFENRQKKRDAKKKELEKFDNIENVASYKSLYEATKKASNGVRFKASVQRGLLTILFRIAKQRKQLLEEKDVRQGFIEFDICERGKVRHIRSVHFAERVIQKSLCNNVLYPVLTNGLIYDNSASQKGKGTLFAQQRLIYHLQEYYKKYGCEGYILNIDFKKYFDSIKHDSVKENLQKHFKDEKLLNLTFSFVDAFGERGLGLGSETSQINAVAHINAIDHYIKETKRCKYYGRYMDDSYIISPSKEFLQELISDLEQKYVKYGIEVNKKKTQIRKISNGFTFLKTKFYLTKTGRIIKKPCRVSITRERRKLKKQARFFNEGILTIEELEQSYQSWRGSMKYRNARRTVHNMDILYNKLFERSIEDGKNI
ncbi:MAG: RNA-directed DNA polymerase [Bacteroidales bacterium]|nr:RNA-directed DNA polymerase [Bacteroidales bacterium]